MRSFESWNALPIEENIFVIHPAVFFEDDDSVMVSNETVAWAFGERNARKIASLPEIVETMRQMTALLRELLPFVSSIGAKAIDELVKTADELFDSFDSLDNLQES